MADTHTSTKVCPRCNIEKQSEFFSKDSRSKSGLQVYCKSCLADYRKLNIDKEKLRQRKYRAENLDKVRAYQRAYREANIDRLSEYNRSNYVENREYFLAKAKDYHNKKRAKRLECMRSYCEANFDRLAKQQKVWREANRDDIAKKKCAYYEANREHARKRTSAYRKANPDKFKIYASNRRAKEIACGGKLSSNIEQKLFKLQRGKCACCGKHLGDNYHIDHIMPLALGGTNTDDNVQLLRSTCNHQKSAKHPIDFMQQRGFLL